MLAADPPSVSSLVKTNSNIKSRILPKIKMPSTQIKDTHREKTPSNKIKAVTKSMNTYIWAIDILNKLFMRDSYGF